ncbi:MAG: hypothetical protein FWD25_06760 [Clostridia bacterium]|nr:hypothetical protein [Clostridia bacterium]
MNRVKFFSTTDWACGMELRKVEQVMARFGSEPEMTTINDCIELFNIKLYLDHELYLSEWSQKLIVELKAIVKHKYTCVARFFASITDDKFEGLYSSLDFDYRDDFWSLVESFKVYLKLERDTLRRLLDSSIVNLREILRHKKIVDHFGTVIREFMLAHVDSAEILLDHYEVRHVFGTRPMYLPKELAAADKTQIISCYINDTQNLNYLQLVARMQSKKEKIELPPKVILKAKKKAEKVNASFFEENSGVRMQASVIFSESQEEPVILTNEGFNLESSYSLKWIEENMDFPTLMNNFIYLFSFTDLCMRWTLISNRKSMGILEEAAFTRSKTDYVKGISFDMINRHAGLQMVSYYHALFRLGIRMEEMIKWFFDGYLPEEFSAQCFRLEMPSSGSTYLEKCTNVMPAFESVLKQFCLYVQEGTVDLELLEIRSDHLFFENVPSLLKNKYAYGYGMEFENASFIFFSSQSTMGYTENSGEKYGTLFDLMRNERVKIGDFFAFQQSRIKWLIEKGYLLEGEEGLLEVADAWVVHILSDLHHNEVACYHHYPQEGQKAINDLVTKEMITYESTLLSRPEQAYLNYFLNRSQFSNGLDLRNQYSHTQPSAGEDQAVHERNYMIFLRLFVMTIIKINDEFCLRSKLEEAQKNEER